MPDPAVTGTTAVLLACAIAFWLARRFATRLNWPQRKLLLYLLVCAPFLPLAAGKETGAGLAMIGFLLALPMFFAVLLAPDKP